MQADKCLGLDGYNPCFFQKFWDMYGKDIFVAGSFWLESYIFPRNMNSTNIPLILKGDI